ncbi:MAG: LLM class F420-dependent oxidoreductase [Chloroflexi bacterium]|nr:LLM class F420-dependent oxidoreductase [Chloroflexota bacterium]
MKVGVVFPQTEIGSDPGAVREYAQAAESLGYNHLLVYDHVLGADTNYYHDWGGFYKLEDQFHEPFVLFGYLAALTQSIQFTTGIIILPQRQTTLVAKQAAEVDVLTGGRLRLGIGIGWNAVEYEALGQNFRDRGRRSEEQVSLLRELWTHETVNFEGKWHRVNHAGLNPMPVQRPIPIWFGGGSEQVLKRIGQTGDGWITTTRNIGLDDSFRDKIDRIHQYAREVGRDPKDIGIEGPIVAGQGSPEDWADSVAQWKSFGATHVSFSTMKSGFDSPQQHIDAIRRFKEAIP